ncbi:FAD/NAD(P)-binding domain-containing protein [Tilletiaria anomala UBC 951]|uniref:FAD/NAD(P)-binding domain-containing protein n=1 Tax=Tilletiaria anomala (strain ATCC 24038 / CBS 436.72 / UBC 951) TaxID=1037660 RepID=A0A066WL21_TILAU|nr:FAD/NAD(P)-binding domain-containing protein [Tilletiaria anomala UBC 951]KDN53273.1 FAD/NAD(P)-binding domain-containing protein [Tilletiaria anomala UBC 951]
MSGLKNVVIIGAASGGATVARALAKSLPETHRIVLIDANEAAFWQVAGLRASVQPGFEDKLFADLATFWKPGSRHIVKPKTKVTELGEDFVVTDAGEKISFDYAVLAMGAKYQTPGRQASHSKAESIASLKQMQAQIAAARHILVVGGGPVGVEFIGEVISQYSGKDKKKITLVHNGKQLIGSKYSASLHSKLSAQLQKAGVHVLLEESIPSEQLPSSTGSLEAARTFTTAKGTSVGDVDFALLSFSGKPNSQLVSAFDASAVDPATQWVRVDEQSLHVLSDDAGKMQRYFALGDVSDAPGGKLVAQINNQGPVIAANIAALVRSSSSKAATAGIKLNAYKPLPTFIAVPLGPAGGAIQTPIATLGEWTVSLIKGKGLFLSNFQSLYKSQ